MNTQDACQIFEALSSPIRLEIFRLLVKNSPQGLVQGDIAAALAIPASNLSFHLKTIAYSKLISAEREGRFMRYKANIPLMLETIAHLTEECCSGNPELCQRFRDESPLQPGILPKR